MSDEDIDLFSDEFVPARPRKFTSVEQIEEFARDNRGSKQKDRWQKNTRKKTTEGPESKVKKKVKDHLVKVYNAKVLRTNAGSIRDDKGNTVYLGETGQSDLQAIIPIAIDKFSFGIFAAIEIKADNDPKRVSYQKAYLGLIPKGKSVGLDAKERKHLDEQKMYIDQIISRGGIGCFAWSTEDVDAAILNKMIEIQLVIGGYREE